MKKTIKNEKTARKLIALGPNNFFKTIFRRVIDISPPVERQLRILLKHNENFIFKSFFNAAAAPIINEKTKLKYWGFRTRISIMLRNAPKLK